MCSCASQRNDAACPCPLWVKADMCGATRDVGYGPIADIASLFDHLVGPSDERVGDVDAERLGYRLELIVLVANVKPDHPLAGTATELAITEMQAGSIAR
jgi:hypothetical protein